MDTPGTIFIFVFTLPAVLIVAALVTQWLEEGKISKKARSIPWLKTHWVNVLFVLLSGFMISAAIFITFMTVLILSDYMTRPWHFGFLANIKKSILACNFLGTGDLLKGLSNATSDEGKEFAGGTGAIVAAAALLITAATMTINRVFAKNNEIVSTVQWCHSRYYELLKETGSGIGEDQSAKNLSEAGYGAFSEFYHCEYDFFLRGLLPTKTFATWMMSWRNYCTPEHNLQGYRNAVNKIGDEDFLNFFEDTLLTVQTLSELKRTLVERRKKWQADRYGILAVLARHVDQEHRSGA